MNDNILTHDAWIARYSGPPPRPIPADAEVVTRRMDMTPAQLVGVVESPTFTATLLVTDFDGHGRLVLDGPIEAVGGGKPQLRGTGRLYGAGPRLILFARINLSITMWSPDAVELRIRPVCSHPFKWGQRRQRRYFDLAHRAGDELRRVLTRAGTQLATGLPASSYLRVASATACVSSACISSACTTGSEPGSPVRTGTGPEWPSAGVEHGWLVAGEHCRVQRARRPSSAGEVVLHSGDAPDLHDQRFGGLSPLRCEGRTQGAHAG